MELMSEFILLHRLVLLSLLDFFMTLFFCLDCLKIGLAFDLMVLIMGSEAFSNLAESADFEILSLK